MVYKWAGPGKGRVLWKDRGGTASLPGEVREGLIDKVTTEMGHKERSLPDVERMEAF